MQKNIMTSEDIQLLEKMGKVCPVSQMKDLRLPFFDVNIVAGFPIPLDNDERSQDIELLRMLCPNPEASYLTKVSHPKIMG